MLLVVLKLMEAVAKWDFVANVSDLLSFEKGDTLKVLFQDTKESSQTWYRAQLNGKEGLVSTNMIEFKSAPWFYRTIDRAKAEEVLSSSFLNKFLIRQSCTRWFLSYKSKDGKVWHFQIFKTASGKFTFFSDDKGKKEFTSLNEIAAFVTRSAWYSAIWWNPHLSSYEDPFTGMPNKKGETEKS